MPKLTALSPIQHNGEDIAVGKVFTVKSAVEAKQLVDAGVAATGEVIDAEAAERAAAEIAAAERAAAEAEEKAAAEAAAEAAALALAEAEGQK